jgi:hypothetical protein
MFSSCRLLLFCFPKGMISTSLKSFHRTNYTAGSLQSHGWTCRMIASPEIVQASPGSDLKKKRAQFKTLQAPTARSLKSETRCSNSPAAPNPWHSHSYCRLLSKHLRNSSSVLFSEEVLDIANVTLRKLRATSLFTSKAS